MANNPMTVSGYVAGTISVPSTPSPGGSNLLALIQAQLDPDCPGSAHVVQVQADFSNTDSIYVGGPTPLGGRLTTTNYGTKLIAGSSRFVGANILGGNSPIQRVFVLAGSGTQSLHVEIVP